MRVWQHNEVCISELVQYFLFVEERSTELNAISSSGSADVFKALRRVSVRLRGGVERVEQLQPEPVIHAPRQFKCLQQVIDALYREKEAEACDRKRLTSAYVSSSSRKR